MEEELKVGDLVCTLVPDDYGELMRCESDVHLILEVYDYKDERQYVRMRPLSGPLTKLTGIDGGISFPAGALVKLCSTQREIANEV